MIIQSSNVSDITFIRVGQHHIGFEKQIMSKHLGERGLGGSMSQVVGSNSSHKPITNTAWVRAQLSKLQKWYTQHAAASDKVYQLLAEGRWFSPGTPASSSSKTGLHDIAEILLKVASNTKSQIQIQSIQEQANGFDWLEKDKYA